MTRHLVSTYHCVKCNTYWDGPENDLSVRYCPDCCGPMIHIPKTTVDTHIRIDKETHNTLMELAHQRGITIKRLITNIADQESARILSH